jgi:hypothetical protein
MSDVTHKVYVEFVGDYLTYDSCLTLFNSSEGQLKKKEKLRAVCQILKNWTKFKTQDNYKTY